MLVGRIKQAETGKSGYYDKLRNVTDNIYLDEVSVCVLQKMITFLKACLSVCNVRSSPSDKSFIMLRYLDGGQLVHYVGNYIETTISNQS